MLSVLQTVEIRGDGCLVDEVADRASGFGCAVQEMERLAFGASHDGDRAVGGHVLAEAAQEFTRLWMGVGGGVEELERERQDVGEGRAVYRSIVSKQ
ncbi:MULTISPECIES: hypothetical protein [Kocuria]|uniref:hypothetical protein n=1 Tax=Kocuria TaxID=57493 RepID=UPI001AF01738|nr:MULTISPECIES: hypothetical protein [Kocuria]